jgi:hypothetical protein
MANKSEEAPLDLSPQALRPRFKKRCLATNNVHQNWQIRVHRALSWLVRALEFPEEELEAKFLFLWIALNSLYSRWNQGINAPDADSHARSDFLDRVCRMDARLVALTLHQHHGLIKRILADPYLSAVFWRDPNHPKAKGWATEDMHRLDCHLKNREYATVLRQVLDRLFVLRGQIVHGASTRGSRWNRAALRYGAQTLQRIVPVLLHVVIENGCGDDWPELCYPPEPQQTMKGTGSPPCSPTPGPRVTEAG